MSHVPKCHQPGQGWSSWRGLRAVTVCRNRAWVWLEQAERHSQGLPRAGTGSCSHRTVNLTFLCDFSSLVLWSLETRGQQSLCLQQCLGQGGNDTCNETEPTRDIPELSVLFTKE